VGEIVRRLGQLGCLDPKVLNGGAIESASEWRSKGGIEDLAPQARQRDGVVEVLDRPFEEGSADQT